MPNGIAVCRHVAIFSATTCQCSFVNNVPDKCRLLCSCEACPPRPYWPLTYGRSKRARQQFLCMPERRTADQRPHPPLFSPLLSAAVHASSLAIRAVRARRWAPRGFGPTTPVPPSPIRGSPRRHCRSAAGARRPPCRWPAGGGSHPSRETVGRHLLGHRVRNATTGTPQRSSSGAPHAQRPLCSVLLTVRNQ